MRERGWRVFASCRQQRDCDRMRAEGFESTAGSTTPTRQSIESGLTRGSWRPLAALWMRLFNNGAHGLPGAVEDLPTEGLRAIFEANFFGWHELTRQVIPVMRANRGTGGSSRTPPSWDLSTFPWRGAYVATKYAHGRADGYVAGRAARAPAFTWCLIEPGPVTSKIREKSIPHFERSHRLADLSPLREPLRDLRLLKRLYESSGPDRFELPASAVTAKLAHACESKPPAAALLRDHPDPYRQAS